MRCQVVSKEFKVIGMKNKGLYKDFGELVPKAAQIFLSMATNLPNHSGVEVSIYEPPKEKGQADGIFYVGLLVNEEADSVPEGMEYLCIRHEFAMIRGQVSEMGKLYTDLDNWIANQGYQHESPDHYMVEVYFPVENGTEEVEVHIPIKRAC
ncbi:GyrI-like domain-containing protein [Bacillus salitolerans]|uniref:GyrI-like domain-containing protein n=1 Tax=Bacillus salitolerans TaxID=1437434 RepID=A0ABW4LUM6_9BACI